MGILDQAPISGNFITKALEIARSVASKPVAVRRVSNMPVKEADFANVIIEEARKRIMKRARGAVAPLSCLRAIEASMKSPTYMDGVKREMELGHELMTGAQSSAMQYAFFAERTAQKWELPGGKITYKSTKPLPINTMGVIGCGTMGTGITISCISVNIPVTLIEVNQQLLDRGMAFIKRVYERNVKQGRISLAMAQKQMSLVNPTLDYGQLANVDCVIEAIFENMKLKKEIFKKLNAVCKPSALLCSNTSSLNIDEIASATTRPDKVAGTHFFSPAHIMKLLENIRGKYTSPETIATVMTLGKTINKGGCTYRKFTLQYNPDDFL
uniref:Peroxisomal bifunctional enzyme-like n=1 Tax=Saccoglossus kowalevskii TaxID=10224 RepID=A0ABM0MKI6_SACKO|nr:PREDICTED: peroxisomal bifunctional enzyme-like [Saccoglossus kowalevskii]